MPIRDANLSLNPESSDLPLIATNVNSTGSIDLEGTLAKGLAVRLNLEWSHGSTIAASINAVVHAATTTPATTSDPIVGEQLYTNVDQASNVELIIPFVTDKRYISLEFQVTGVASDSPSWSVVEAYVVENVGKAWDRNINFH